MTYYVTVNDEDHEPFPVYTGRSRAAAHKALMVTERVLFGILGTAYVTHNLSGKRERLEWTEGCPPEDGTTFEEKKAAWEDD